MMKLEMSIASHGLSNAVDLPEDAKHVHTSLLTCNLTDMLLSR